MKVEESNVPLAAELAELAARMSPLLLAEESVESAVTVLTSLALETIEGASGAGVTLVDAAGSRISKAATSDLVRQADDQQYELGEGPCLTAYAETQTVWADDLTNEPRWPRWAEATVGMGLLSSVSSPLVIDERVLGAVKVYGDRAHAFDDRAVRLLEGFAATAALLLGNVVSVDHSRQLSATLREALHARDAVQIAKGILMQRDGRSEDDALQLLVGRARVANRVLHEVADDVIRSTPASVGETAVG